MRIELDIPDKEAADLLEKGAASVGFAFIETCAAKADQLARFVLMPIPPFISLVSRSPDKISTAGVLMCRR